MPKMTVTSLELAEWLETYMNEHELVSTCKVSVLSVDKRDGGFDLVITFDYLPDEKDQTVEE